METSLGERGFCHDIPAHCPFFAYLGRGRGGAGHGDPCQWIGRSGGAGRLGVGVSPGALSTGCFCRSASGGFACGPGVSGPFSPGGLFAK